MFETLIQQAGQTIFYILAGLFILALALTGGSDDEEGDDSEKRDRKSNKGDDDD